jgi:hypothetical protein
MLQSLAFGGGGGSTSYNTQNASLQMKKPGAGPFRHTYDATMSVTGGPNPRPWSKYQAPMVGPRVGRADATRVSRGDLYEKHKTLSVKTPKRNPTKQFSATVVAYKMVFGGVPSEWDIIAAAADLVSLYEACSRTRTPPVDV